MHIFCKIYILDFTFCEDVAVILEYYLKLFILFYCYCLYKIFCGIVIMLENFQIFHLNVEKCIHGK